MCASNMDIIWLSISVFIIAIALSIVFSCLVKRKSYRLNVLNGRPSMPIPIPFLDGYTKRSEYCLVSCVLATTVFQFLISAVNANIPTWATALLTFVVIIIAVLSTAPIALAVTTPYRLIGSILGFIYVSIVLALYIVLVSGVNEELILPTVFTYLPMLIGCTLLIGLFGYKFYVSVRTRKYIMEEDSICQPHQELYVHQVLNIPTVQRPNIRRFEWLRYSSRPDFLYPVNILVPVTISAVIVYEMAVTLFTDKSLTLIFQYFSSDEDVHDSTIFYILLCNKYVSIVLSAMLAYFHIYVFLRQYRKHVLRMYAGNPSQLIALFKKTSPVSIVSWSVLFKGYFMGYTLLGFLSVFLATWFILTVFIAGGYIIDQSGLLKSLLSYLAQWLLLPVLMLIIFAFQKVLTRFFFLQQKLKADDEFQPLNVNNRHCFEFISYCWMFINLSVGMLSGIIRIVTSTLIGVFMVGCLERPMLIRGLEKYDRGFFSYVSMMYVDVSHNHPILRVFIKLLWGPNIHQKEQKYEDSLSRAKKRWYLAYTLMKNPQITQLRKNNINICNPVDVDVELQSIGV